MALFKSSILGDFDSSDAGVAGLTDDQIREKIQEFASNAYANNVITESTASGYMEISISDNYGRAQLIDTLRQLEGQIKGREMPGKVFKFLGIVTIATLGTVGAVWMVNKIKRRR